METPRRQGHGLDPTTLQKMGRETLAAQGPGVTPFCLGKCDAFHRFNPLNTPPPKTPPKKKKNSKQILRVGHIVKGTHRAFFSN